jgi:hypothetical protein
MITWRGDYYLPVRVTGLEKCCYANDNPKLAGDLMGRALFV